MVCTASHIAVSEQPVFKEREPRTLDTRVHHQKVDRQPQLNLLNLNEKSCLSLAVASSMGARSHMDNVKTANRAVAEGRNLGTPGRL